MAYHYSAGKGTSWWNDGVEANQAPVVNEQAPTTAITQSGSTVVPTVVQPFVVVPYVSQMQPLYQYDYSDTQSYQSDDTEDYSESYGEKIKSDYSISIFKIFAMIFALLSIAVLVIGKFVALDLLNIYGVNNGLAIIMTLKNGIEGLALMDMIITMGIAAVALFAVLIFIICLITVKRKSKVFKRVLCVLQLICILAVGYAIMHTGAFSDIGYGLYALAGISVISFIF